MTIDTCADPTAASPSHDGRGALPVWPAATTPGRLAAMSRTAQGFDPTVTDPAALARLRDLCAAPRPPQTSRCA
ncbi:MAG: hypothetical protein LBK95_10315 [Bifidobacteriaceae bacterium]|nr:hypothetical protein [Bifidobacteriaceae bacterium]